MWKQSNNVMKTSAKIQNYKSENVLLKTPFFPQNTAFYIFILQSCNVSVYFHLYSIFSLLFHQNTMTKHNISKTIIRSSKHVQFYFDKVKYEHIHCCGLGVIFSIVLLEPYAVSKQNLP